MGPGVPPGGRPQFPWAPPVGVAAGIAGLLLSPRPIAVVLLVFTGVLAAVIAADWAVRNRRRRPHIPGEAREAWTRWSRRVLGALTGALVAFSGWVVIPPAIDAIGGLGEPCEPPAELRVMAAPEYLRGVQRTAAEFAADRAAGRDCRPVHLTVFPAPEPARVEQSFQSGWALTETPRPDVWLPAGGDLVAAAGRAEPGAPRPTGPDVPRPQADPRSLGTFPLTLAVPEQVDRDLGLSSATSWADLIGRISGPGTDLNMPGLAETETGHLAALALFDGHTGPGDLIARQRLIRMVNRAGQAPADPDEILCGLRDAGGAGGERVVAAIVPQSAVRSYNIESPEGAHCGPAPDPDGGRRLTAIMPPGGTPALDPRFVRITWPAEDDPVRGRFAERFRDWVFRPEHNPFGASYGGEPRRGEPGQGRLATARDLVTKARQPLSLQFVLDMSGTMNTSTAQGPLLSLARNQISDVLDRLGGQDIAALWRMPATGGAARDPALLVPANKPGGYEMGQSRRIRDRLRSLRSATAPVTPLFHTITFLSGSDLVGSTDVVVVLTDGKNDDPQGRKDDFALREEMKDALGNAGGLRVVVVVPLPGGCDRALKDLPQITGFRCVDMDGKGALIDRLFDELSGAKG